jgi:hypothetical protein
MVMRHLILSAALAVSLTACNGVFVPNIPMPAQVQTACTFIEVGLPLVEGFRSRLTLAEQNFLTAVEMANKECVAGNATMAILDLAQGLEAIIVDYTGMTKAQVMARHR